MNRKADRLLSETSVVHEADGAWLDALPEPHPLIPKATARRGTRRMAPELRAVVGSPLTRRRAAELMAAGELDPGRCSVVWNMQGRAVSHPVSQVQVPSLGSLQPVRRIGTHKQAESKIAMLPVMRDGLITMLELESQLELHHAIQLSLDPRVDTLLAQPFLMVWRHEEGSMVHVPDLAARVGGQVTAFAVKPDDRSCDERTQRLFEFIATSLECGRIEFEVLGSMSKQRQINLTRIARYRWHDANLQALMETAASRAPRTVGGLLRLVDEHLTEQSASVSCPGSGHNPAGVDVAFYALAHGCVSTDLDVPLNLATTLAWRGRDAS